MKRDTREWDLNLINQIFHSFDAEEIAKIRIPSVEYEDTAAWHYEKNGVFMVKSAYKLSEQLMWDSLSKPSKLRERGG